MLAVTRRSSHRTPALLFIDILVKLTSPGPVFYTQIRVGHDRRQRGNSHPGCRRERDRGGRPFRIFKFRTMTVDDSPQPKEAWAMANDPRITRVGAVLRKYRLDEIPQLVNVLLGDMNIVGPRPEQPTLFQELRGQIPRYGERQRARPGITGLAQVNQHYDRNIDDVRRKVNFDLAYIANQSPVEDVKIMLKTVPVMLFKKGSQ